MPYEQCGRLVLRLVAEELKMTDGEASKRFGTQNLRSGGCNFSGSKRGQ